MTPPLRVTEHLSVSPEIEAAIKETTYYSGVVTEEGREPPFIVTLRSAIASAVAQARQDALEEAVKVAEAHRDSVRDRGFSMHEVGRFGEVVGAIRALLSPSSGAAPE